MSDFPKVRIELQRMKYLLMAALAPALEAERDQIYDLVKEAIKDFDFAAEVKPEVHRQISEQMGKAVKRATARAFLSKEVQKIFDRHATETVRQTLEYMERK